MKTVAIIPCLNEQDHIIAVVTGAKQFVDTVIVADNNSTDQTAKYARQAGAIVITCEKEGLGNNLIHTFNSYLWSLKIMSKSGDKLLNPDIIILLDGDGQHNPSDIPALLKPLELGLADVVLGDRYQSPLIRSIGIRALTWLFNINHSIKVNDPMIGFWAIRTNALYIPADRGWGCYIEMLEKARRNKKRIMSVPVTVNYSDRYSDNSSKPALWLGMCLLLKIIKYRLESVK